MSDEIDRAFAEALSELEATEGYECRNCGLIFEAGRDARQHMFSEHSNPLGIKRITE